MAKLDDLRDLHSPLDWSDPQTTRVWRTRSFWILLVILLAAASAFVVLISRTN